MKVLDHTSDFPGWGGPTKGLRIPRKSGLEGQRDLIIGFPQDWGKQTAILEDTNKMLHAPGPREKEQWPKRWAKTTFQVLGGCPGEMWVSRGSAQAQGRWQQQSRKLPLGIRPLGGRHSSKEPQQGASPTPPSANNCIKAFLSKALRTTIRPFFPHQSLSSGSLLKLLSLLQRADRSKNHSFTRTRTKPHYWKLVSMKSTKLYPRGRDKIKPSKNH